MTRTDVMASSRPRTAGAAKRVGIRRLAVLPIVLLLGMALLAPGAALAASESNSSGYNQEPNKPSTGTSPSKETTTPSSETTPTTTTATPTTTTSASKSLPFTGLDLRWSFGLGLLLLGAGLSIVFVQRRGRGTNGL